MRGSKALLTLLRRSWTTSTPLLSSSAVAFSSHGASAPLSSTAPKVMQRRWQTAATPTAAAASSTDNAAAATAASTSGATEDASQAGTAAARTHVMERAADARREIHALWSDTAASEDAQHGTGSSARAPINSEESVAAEAEVAEQRCAAVAALLEKYQIDPATPREADVSRGLGDALDRLLLLCVPLSASHGTELLVKLMQVSARQGRQLSMRTIQHLFARTNSYAEALAIFYAMRRSHFAMSMEAYHAMLYSLQRLEEEGWAQRFHDEYTATKGEAISEQALDFVLRGVDNQLLPENKPWLGRVMFAEVKDNPATQRQSRASFDEMGQLWVERYKSGSSSVNASGQSGETR